MSKNLPIQKTVYNREKYRKVVSSNFTTFVPPPPDADPTIEDFFNLYESLFYEIPADGDIQSHSYLIRRSSELVDFEKDTQDIQPLLDEIADLREQLLEANGEILQLEIQVAGQETGPNAGEEFQLFQQEINSTQ